MGTVEKLSLSIVNFKSNMMLTDSNKEVARILNKMLRSVNTEGIENMQNQIVRDSKGNTVGKLSVIRKV